MTDDAVSPLRRRMIEDMTIRQFGEHTKRDYVRQVREFAMFLGRSPWSAPAKCSSLRYGFWPFGGLNDAEEEAHA